MRLQNQSANLVKTTGDAAVVTTVPGTEETTTTGNDTTVKQQLKLLLKSQTLTLIMQLKLQNYCSCIKRFR